MNIKLERSLWNDCCFVQVPSSSVLSLWMISHYFRWFIFLKVLRSSKKVVNWYFFHARTPHTHNCLQRTKNIDLLRHRWDTIKRPKNWPARIRIIMIGHDEYFRITKSGQICYSSNCKPTVLIWVPISWV